MIVARGLGVTFRQMMAALTLLTAAAVELPAQIVVTPQGTTTSNKANHTPGFPSLPA